MIGVGLVYLMDFIICIIFVDWRDFNNTFLNGI